MKKRNRIQITYLFLIVALSSCASNINNNVKKAKIWVKKDFRMPERSLAKSFVKEKSSPNKYASHEWWQSSYLILNEDSSFIYSCFYEIGHALTVGNYNLTNQVYTFKWDSIKTFEAYSDTMFLKHKLKVGSYKSIPNKIDNVAFYLSGDTLILVD